MGHPMRKSDRNRLSLDRILIETEDWTAKDWRDLHEAIDVAIQKIRWRHLRRMDDERERTKTDSAIIAGRGEEPERLGRARPAE
jgi:phage anti-repressor protein